MSLLTGTASIVRVELSEPVLRLEFWILIALAVVSVKVIGSRGRDVLNIAEGSVFVLGGQQQQGRLAQVRIRSLCQARPAQQVGALRHAVHVNVWCMWFLCCF